MFKSALCKLREIWRSAPPETLGKNFEKLIAAHDQGGFTAVEQLLASVSISGHMRANGYTALARYLMNVDCVNAANAARRAYILDPKTYRLKWLVFRLYEAGEAIQAKALFDILPADTSFSESEARRADQLCLESLPLQQRGATQADLSCADPSTLDFPVDIVYLWSSGSPKRMALRQQYLNPDAPQNANFSIARTRQNDELKYALRSIEKNLPWIRNVFIVVDDNEYPEWLDIKNPRVKIVNTSEIIDAKYLPVFNSNLIEMNVYKIPELSGNFLMSCDDFMVLKPLPKSYFFNQFGTPIYRTRRPTINEEGKYYQHLKFIAGIATFFTKTNCYSKIVMTYHGIQAHSKASIQYTLERTGVRFLAEVANKNRFRNELSDLDHLLYALIGESRGEYKCMFIEVDKYIKDEAGRTVKNKKWKGDIRLLSNNHSEFHKYINIDDLKQIAINDEDQEEISDSHKIIVRLFLERLFPDKSLVEL